MKVIETEYNGYLFRSRLEARWAVFFDVFGLQYYYEHEGYVLSNGVRYLPDFYLPELDCHIEIKPNVFKPFKPPDRVLFNGEFKKDYETKWLPFMSESQLLVKFGLPDGLPSSLMIHETHNGIRQSDWNDVLFYKQDEHYYRFWWSADGEDWTDEEPYKSAIKAAKQARF